MSVYTLNHLFNDCVTRRARITRSNNKLQDIKKETFESIWKAINLWIDSRFDIGKGVHLAPFAKITWEQCLINGKNGKKVRPIFILDDAFSRTHSLPIKRKLIPPILASMEDINYTKIAIKYSNRLTKDLVFSGLRDLLQRLGEMMGSGQSFSIDFNIGKFIGKEKEVNFIFDPQRFPALLTNQISQSLLTKIEDLSLEPQEITTNHTKIEDEFPIEIKMKSPTKSSIKSQMEDPFNTMNHLFPNLKQDMSLHDEVTLFGSNLDNNNNNNKSVGKEDVLQAAYSRHLKQLEKEINEDTLAAFEIQRKHEYDKELIEKEKLQKRQAAELLQKKIQEQILQNELIKENEKIEKDKIKKESCSIIPLNSSHEHLVYTMKKMTKPNYHPSNKKKILKNKNLLTIDGVNENEEELFYYQLKKHDQNQLKNTLTEQINKKEENRLLLKELTLNEEKNILNKIHNEMIEQEKLYLNTQKEKQKILTEEWKRDKNLKQVVHLRKKNIIQQVQNVSNIPKKRNESLRQINNFDLYNEYDKDNDKNKNKSINKENEWFDFFNNNTYNSKKEVDLFSVGFDIRSQHGIH